MKNWIVKNSKRVILAILVCIMILLGMDSDSIMKIMSVL